MERIFQALMIVDVYGTAPRISKLIVDPIKRFVLDRKVTL